MSKKTNSISLRLLKQKNWSSKSFFEDYNYSKLLYQDFYIQNYVKNYCESQLEGGFVHNISTQRIDNTINIFLDFYRVKHFASFFNFGKQKSQFLSFKRHRRWKAKKQISQRYFSLPQEGLSRYQKYTLNVLRIKPKRENTPCLFNERLKKNLYLPIFSIKRLLLLNLTLLTGCKINLYTKNIAHLSNFPVFLANNFQKTSEINTVKKVLSRLKIQSQVNRLVGLDTVQLIHLFYTSIFFKNSSLLGLFLGRVIKKNIKSFNFFFFFITRLFSTLFIFSGLNGLKVQFKGRLGTSLRKKKSIISLGSMPLQTSNSLIKYSFTEVFTIYGVCGIKVWYYY